jgi:hypothetical protein
MAVIRSKALKVTLTLILSTVQGGAEAIRIAIMQSTCLWKEDGRIMNSSPR